MSWGSEGGFRLEIAPDRCFFNLEATKHRVLSLILMNIGRSVPTITSTDYPFCVPFGHFGKADRSYWRESDGEDEKD